MYRCWQLHSNVLEYASGEYEMMKLIHSWLPHDAVFILPCLLHYNANYYDFEKTKQAEFFSYNVFKLQKRNGILVKNRVVANCVRKINLKIA